MGGGHNVPRGLAGLLFCAILFAGVVTPAASAPLDQSSSSAPTAAAVQMDVHAGFDGAGRVGGWAPVNVDLVNQGSEVRGEIQIVVQPSGARSSFTAAPTLFALPVVLPRLSHKHFTLDVNFPTASNRIVARLVRSQGGDAIAEQEVSMTRVPLGDYFCGILARDPASYDFLTAQDLPPPIRRVRTAPLDPASIPDQAQLLASFDCIVVDNASTAQLRPEQINALDVWTGTGGLLILVGGATAQSTLGPLPPQLMPVELTGLINVTSLSSVGDLMQQPLDGGGPWLLSQSRPRVEDGAHVVATQEGVPAIVGAKRGDGTVIYLAFEPTTRAFNAWPGNTAFWRYVITHASLDSGVGSSLVRPYLRWGRLPRLAMSDFSAQPRASLNWLWPLMAGYVLALAAGLFVAGRRAGARSALVAALGTTATAGTLAFLLAQQHGESQLAITHLSVVRPIDSGPGGAAYTHDYYSILAKRDGPFNLTLPGSVLPRGMYYPFPRPTDESDNGWTFRVSEGANPLLDNLVLRQGQLGTAVSDGEMQQAPGVQAQVRVQDGALTGALANRTGGRLSDAYIITEGQFTPLGTLERDQQRQIDILLPRQASAGAMAASTFAQSMTPADASSRPGATARRDLMESLLSARFAAGRMDLSGPTLVGWLEKAPQSIEAPGVNLSTSDFALLVQPLRPILPRGFEGEVPATVMSRRDLGIGTSTPSDRDYYTLGPGEAVTLQFTLPGAEGPFQFRDLRVNVEGSVAGRGQLAPARFTIALYSWKDGEWQNWQVGPGTSVVPDGSRYVSAGGDLRLRYMADASLAPAVREIRVTRLDVTPTGVVL